MAPDRDFVDFLGLIDAAVSLILHVSGIHNSQSTGSDLLLSWSEKKSLQLTSSWNSAIGVSPDSRSMLAKVFHVESGGKDCVAPSTLLLAYLTYVPQRLNLRIPLEFTDILLDDLCAVNLVLAMVKECSLREQGRKNNSFSRS